MATLSNRDEFSALLNQGAAKLAISLSARQIEKLLDYLALLVKWNSVYNLTSVRDPTANGHTTFARCDVITIRF